MRLFVKKVSRFFSVLLSFVFLANLSFATQPEINLWRQRQDAARERNNRKSPYPVASLPSSLPSFSSTLLSHPVSAVVPSRLLTPSLPATVSSAAALLPASFGSVRSIAIPENGVKNVVIHVQDVHLNEEAQRNISKTLKTLLESKKIGLVALEGTVEPLDIADVRKFSDQDAVREAADYMLGAGKISGPAHAALTAAGTIPAFIGVDHKDRYKANVDAYKRAAPLVQENKARWLSFGKSLEEQKKSVFNGALGAFDARVAGYRDGKISLGGHVALLMKHAVPSEALRQFAGALEMEKSLNFSRVEAERSALIAALTPRLSKGETAALLNLSLALRLGKVTANDFYGRLKEMAADQGLFLNQWPSMALYIRYAALSERIDADRLFDGIVVAENEAYAALARTEEERELIELSKRFHWIGRLLDFSLTPQEWQAYKKSALDKSALCGLTAESIEPFETFYREAEARDEAIAANLRRALKELGPDSAAVLVTGGFHTPGLTRILTENGVAAITFAPAISHLDAAVPSYLNVFTAQPTPLEKLFEGNKLFTSPDPMSPANGFLTRLLAGGGAVRKGAKPDAVKAELGLSRYSFPIGFKTAAAAVLLISVGAVAITVAMAGPKIMSLSYAYALTAELLKAIAFHHILWAVGITFFFYLSFLGFTANFGAAPSVPGKKSPPPALPPVVKKTNDGDENDRQAGRRLTFLQAGLRTAGTLFPVHAARSNTAGDDPLEGDWGSGDVETMHPVLTMLSSAGQRILQWLPINWSSGFNSPFGQASSLLKDPVFINVASFIKEMGQGNVSQPNVEAFLSKHAEDIVRLRRSKKIQYDDTYDNEAKQERIGVRNLKTGGLTAAWKDLKSSPDHALFKAYLAYRERSEAYLENHILYVVLKEHFIREEMASGVHWTQTRMWDFRLWPHGLNKADPSAMRLYRAKFSEEIDFEFFRQFVFDRQLRRLLDDAKKKGIDIKFDRPAAFDGADVWLNQELFGVSDGPRAAVWGVPPDMFSNLAGQVWQFWWLMISRARGRAYLTKQIGESEADVLRFDHELKSKRGFMFTTEHPALNLEKLGLASIFEMLRTSVIVPGMSNEARYAAAERAQWLLLLAVWRLLPASAASPVSPALGKREANWQVIPVQSAEQKAVDDAFLKAKALLLALPRIDGAKIEGIDLEALNRIFDNDGNLPASHEILISRAIDHQEADLMDPHFMDLNDMEAKVFGHRNAQKEIPSRFGLLRATPDKQVGKDDRGWLFYYLFPDMAAQQELVRAKLKPNNEKEVARLEARIAYLRKTKAVQGTDGIRLGYFIPQPGESLISECLEAAQRAGKFLVFELLGVVPAEVLASYLRLGGMPLFPLVYGLEDKFDDGSEAAYYPTRIPFRSAATLTLHDSHALDQAWIFLSVEKRRRLLEGRWPDGTPFWNDADLGRPWNQGDLNEALTDEVHEFLLALIFKSAAQLAVLNIHDAANDGKRINDPANAVGNWEDRFDATVEELAAAATGGSVVGALAGRVVGLLKKLTVTTGRGSPELDQPKFTNVTAVDHEQLRWFEFNGKISSPFLVDAIAHAVPQNGSVVMIITRNGKVVAEVPMESIPVHSDSYEAGLPRSITWWRAEWSPANPGLYEFTVEARSEEKRVFSSGKGILRAAEPGVNHNSLVEPSYSIQMATQYLHRGDSAGRDKAAEFLINLLNRDTLERETAEQAAVMTGYLFDLDWRNPEFSPLLRELIQAATQTRVLRQLPTSAKLTLLEGLLEMERALAGRSMRDVLFRIRVERAIESLGRSLPDRFTRMLEVFRLSVKDNRLSNIEGIVITGRMRDELRKDVWVHISVTERGTLRFERSPREVQQLKVDTKGLREITDDVKSQIGRARWFRFFGFIIRFLPVWLQNGLKPSLLWLPIRLPLPSGRERGAGGAFDWGGSSWKLVAYTIENNKITRSDVQSDNFNPVDKKSMRAAMKTFAGRIASYVRRQQLGEVASGFTFAFEIEQKAPGAAVMTGTSKGWADDLVNKEIVSLLNGDLRSEGVAAQIDVLANDTADGLLAYTLMVRMGDPDAAPATVSIINGTGHNMAMYLYPNQLVGAVSKWLLDLLGPLATFLRIEGLLNRWAHGQIINLETGGYAPLAKFRSELDYKADDSLRAQGVLRDYHQFEKLIAGQGVVELVKAGVLQRRPDWASALVSLGGGDLSTIENLRLNHPLDPERWIRGYLQEHLGVTGVSDADVQLFLNLTYAAFERSARLLAAAFVGSIKYVDPALRRNHAVTLQGGLYKFPGYLKMMEKAVVEILGEKKAAKITLVDMNDHVGLGIAGAAMAQRSLKKSPEAPATAKQRPSAPSSRAWFTLPSFGFIPFLPAPSAPTDGAEPVIRAGVNGFDPVVFFNAVGSNAGDVFARLSTEGLSAFSPTSILIAVLGVAIISGLIITVLIRAGAFRRRPKVTVDQMRPLARALLDQMQEKGEVQTGLIIAALPVVEGNLERKIIYAQKGRGFLNLTGAANRALGQALREEVISRKLRLDQPRAAQVLLAGHEAVSQTDGRVEDMNITIGVNSQTKPLEISQAELEEVLDRPGHNRTVYLAGSKDDVESLAQSVAIKASARGWAIAPVINPRSHAKNGTSSFFDLDEVVPAVDEVSHGQATRSIVVFDEMPMSISALTEKRYPNLLYIPMDALLLRMFQGMAMDRNCAEQYQQLMRQLIYA